MKLTPRQLATVLAALRVYQTTLQRHVRIEGVDSQWFETIMDIASDGGNFIPADAAFIDRLCETINSGE